MKFLILFAVAALFGCVQCDEDCFRAVFKECVRDSVPLERMTLCDEVSYEIDCIARFAKKCDMTFFEQAGELRDRVNQVCKDAFRKEWYDEGKACYKKTMNTTQCAGPIKEAMRDFKTQEDFIRANKKICNLMEPYATCMDDELRTTCGVKPWALHFWLTKPLYQVSKSLCEQLIIPADETDSRTDSFGNLNVYAALASMFS